MHRTVDLAILAALAIGAAAYWLLFNTARRLAVPAHF